MATIAFWIEADIHDAFLSDSTRSQVRMTRIGEDWQHRAGRVVLTYAHYYAEYAEGAIRQSNESLRGSHVVDHCNRGIPALFPEFLRLPARFPELAGILDLYLQIVPSLKVI
ncbi:uncharacterized protein N7473_008630 [Penicillium subrubescens]|jgi:hypothetical protein|uniref:Uncharacterized protein n=1 Tax=Penicillium subrubescens TaxID=1316194 RepID=A0A1Q5U056_9EURO|nr:uncharacterized protein N7473_008630 [Penicillium subrubescens]KAJ5885956.1 hypothetical protein N7473_008630 [Penicillium subrubescens]OKP05858.1 hypothetical protein PENSUB_6578 [Penicillium subrubescens]